MNFGEKRINADRSRGTGEGQNKLSLSARGIAQTAVVAVKEIRGGDVFEFAYELFSSWGVGSKSDSGIGILLVEQEREIRFVTGYGIEGVLPDAICKRIQMQYMLPYFREGDNSSGMVAGVEAIRAVLNGSELDAGGNDDYQAWQRRPFGKIVRRYDETRRVYRPSRLR